MRIQLLGGFSVSVTGESIPKAQWKSRRARNLVKLLALAPGHRLHRDQIIETFWPDSDLNAAANNFHQTLYGARRVLEPLMPGCLALEEGFLSLSGAITVDVEAFEAAAKRAEESQDLVAYRDALAVYKGDLLQEDLYEEWTVQRRESLRQEYLRLLLGLAWLYETRQEYAVGIEILQNLLAVDKSHEEAHAGLMRLYALSGQRQLALRQYQTLREVLQAELGVDPTPTTARLYEEIQTGKSVVQAAQSASPEGSPSTGQTPRHNLPFSLTSFIGREKEIETVSEMLEHQRLVTLHGSGGVGKTRLALQSAQKVMNSFADGAWLIELASLADPETVDQTVAAALGLQRISEISYQTLLVNFLRDKHLLLILDNCEHLLGACARLANYLLQGCPRLCLLVTSREVLGITGEVSYRVPSLSAPDPATYSPEELIHIEAVQLFTERAAVVLPGFHLSGQALRTVAQICHGLDGIPLAIELAAARVSVLSIEQIAARLDDRFRLLTGGSRTALPRQRTLRASIDWSYGLLSDSERLLLQRLSVFSGGWTLDAAEKVCALDGLEAGEILDGLASLVNQSLVVANTTGGDETRYHMLETIRQFAQEKLDESGLGSVLRERHLDLFLALAEEYGPLLHTQRIVEVLNRLDLELDNLRGAIAWALGQDSQAGAEKVVRIMDALQYFWFTRALVNDVKEWAYSTIRLLADNDPKTIELRARALLITGSLHVAYGLDAGKASDDLRESLRLFRLVKNRHGEALACCHLYYALIIFITPDSRDQYKRAHVTNLEEAHRFGQESRDLAQTLLRMPDRESRWTGATVCFWNGWTASWLYENPLSKNLFQQAMLIFNELGDQLGMINSLAMDDAFHYDGIEQITLRTPLLQENLSIARKLKSKLTILGLCIACGRASLDLSRYQEAVDYFKECRRFGRDIGDSYNEIYPSRMVAYAQYKLDDIIQARESFFESLALSIQFDDPQGIYLCLVYLAGIAVRSHAEQRAVNFMGFIERQYETYDKVMDARDRIEYDDLVTQVKPLFSMEDFDSLWHQGRGMSLDEALDLARIV